MTGISPRSPRQPRTAKRATRSSVPLTWAWEKSSVTPTSVRHKSVGKPATSSFMPAAVRTQARRRCPGSRPARIANRPAFTRLVQLTTMTISRAANEIQARSMSASYELNTEQPQPSRPWITVPVQAGSGRPVRSWTSRPAGTPSRCRNVAVRSAGATGRRPGRRPWRPRRRRRCRPGRRRRPARSTARAASGRGRRLVDLRRAAELAHAHDQRVVQQAALRQVVEQGGERPGRSAASAARAGARKLFSVRVPHRRVVRPLVVPVDGHQRHARLQQPPGQQAALAEQVPAVGVAHAVRLAVQLERPPHRRRAEQVETPARNSRPRRPSPDASAAASRLELVRSNRRRSSSRRRSRPAAGRCRAAGSRSAVGVGLDAEAARTRLPRKPASLAGELVDAGVLDDLRQRHERRQRRRAAGRTLASSEPRCGWSFGDGRMSVPPSGCWPAGAAAPVSIV